MTDMPLPISPDSDPPESEGSRFAKAHHILLYFLIGTLIVWLLSGFYQVKADEIAIIERLGQYITTPDGTKAIQIEEGMHYHLPWPIDTVHKVSVQQIATLRVNAFDAPPDAFSEQKTNLQRLLNLSPAALSIIFDPYLITADKSVIHMDITIGYRINDPEAWLNTVSHNTLTAATESDLREELFQHIAQHAMITQVAHMTLEQVLFSELQSLRQNLYSTMQDAMVIRDPSMPDGKRDLGVQLQAVDISRVRPPDRAKAAYDQVQQARNARDSALSTAQSEAASTNVRATGQLTTLILNAERDKKTTIEAARGEAERFKQILSQFENAPDITRWTLFADALRSVSTSARRIIYAQPGQRTFIQVDPPQLDAGQPQPRP